VTQLRVSSLVDGQGGVHVQVHFISSHIKATDERATSMSDVDTITGKAYLPPPMGDPRAFQQSAEHPVCQQGGVDPDDHEPRFS
jgi:hypothetical protein